MTIEERINELGEKYEKQKEINKELVDYNARLLDQAGAATKRAIELETENNKLLDVINGQDVKIADLESENKKLEKRLVFARAEFQRQYKENEELKNKIGIYQKGMYDEIEKRDRKLTKAKEHIKQLLDCLKQDTNDPQTNYYVCQYMDKAEQFLKEIEK